MEPRGSRPGILRVAAALAVAATVGRRGRTSLAEEVKPRTQPPRVPGMVHIPAGELVIGTPKEEAARLARRWGVHEGFFSVECPKRTVELAAYYVDRYPVTRGQYSRFLQATGRRPPRCLAGGLGAGWENVPVVDVTWDDAAAYAGWAGKRLPTEEEWEMAAGSGDGRAYPWGNDFEAGGVKLFEHPYSIAWQPVPVGANPKSDSPYGVSDMSGLVMQWTDSVAGRMESERVIKGGASVFTRPYSHRCATRVYSAHTMRRHDFLGFRCALSSDKAADWMKAYAEKVGAPAPGDALPRQAKVPPPAPELCGKERIRVGGGHITFRLHVPWLPAGEEFLFWYPENIHADALNIWKMPLSELKKQVKRWTNEEKTEAGYEATAEGIMKATFRLRCEGDSVWYRFTIKNLSGKTFKRLDEQACFNSGWSNTSPYLHDLECVRTYFFTDHGPVKRVCIPPRRGRTAGEFLHYTVRTGKPGDLPEGSYWPVIATESVDRRFVVANARGAADYVGGNAHYTCMHVSEAWADVADGQEVATEGRLYFMQGTIQDFVARYKRDFGVLARGK